VICRVYMLVYNAAPEVAAMTQAAVDKVLESTGDDVRLVVAYNGGAIFPVRADERIDTVAWADRTGLGEAYNALVNAHDDPYICLMHNDCFVPDGGWLYRLIATAESTGFAFPKVRSDDEDLRLRGMTKASDVLPPSCCYVIERKAWEKVGGFDTAFEGCHFEDMDLFLRAKKLGYEMARVSSVEVFHRRGATRVLTADESNAAFRKNGQIYASKWGHDGLAEMPTLVEARG
jgi:GT2 family glycosyltransferase